MKYFCLKLAAVLTAVIIVVFVANALYIRSRHIYLYHEIRYFSEVSRNLDLVNLGSSHGAAFHFLYYDEIHAWNLSMGAQVPYYDFEILKRFSCHLNNNAVVLIPLSFFSFYNCPDHEKKLKDRYYLVLKNNSIVNPDYFFGFFKRRLPLLTVSKNWLDVLWFDNDFRIDTTSKPLPVEDREKKAHMTRTGWESMQRYRPAAELLEYNTQIIHSLIEYCLEKGFRPVLISTPLHSSMKLAYTADEINGFTSLAERLTELYPSVHYLNYTFDEDFSLRDDLFSDNNHLNWNGKGLFTRRVREDLIQLNLYPLSGLIAQ